MPRFLYRSVLSAEGLELVFDVPRDPKAKGLPEAKYRPWFLAVARGESFAKASRDVFTKREAHLFLQVPDGRSIEETVFWTRALAAGVPKVGCDFLVERLDAAFRKAVGDRMPDLLRFYAEGWPEMRGYDRDEITDFVRAMARDPDFSFKGRTFGSMRKRCAEWHRTSFSGHVREYRAWTPGFEPWEFRKGGVAVRAEELTNNRLLADEGRTQRHCVLTYTSLCLQGRSRIVSLRWFGVVDHVEIPTRELSRLTLEVSPAQRSIVQIRGKMNRGATEEEMRAVRHWAGDQGLKIEAYA